MKENTFNEYGTIVSVHICETCSAEFTVCPAVEEKNRDQWRYCLSLDCVSYDPDRDADKFFDKGVVKKESTGKYN